MKFWLLLSFFALSSCGTHSVRNNYFSSAEYYSSKGQWEDAIALSDLAVKADPQHEDAYLLKAQCLSKLGKYTEAHQLIHERLTLTPHSTKINLALANWHLDYGAKEAALSVAKSMIRRDQSNLAAHRIIAKLSLEAGQWSDSVTSLRKITFNDKFDEESALTLGQLYLKLEKPKNAIRVFNALFEGKTKKFEAAKYLGWIHADMGHTSEANRFIQFLSLDKRNDPFVEKVITRNFLNSKDVDKIAVLTNYLEKNTDDWGQHQLYLALQESGYQERALDLLAKVWNSSAEKKWAAINYANHLNKIGDTKVAMDILNKASLTSDDQDKKLIAATIQSWGDPNAVPSRSVAGLGKVHIVKHGETLGQISLRYFQTTQAWQKIFRANQNKIEDPSILQEGMELIIPKDRP
jgi:tetratricopeptide (TPR) repeat protein